MIAEACRTCLHWRRSLPKQKHGWCYAWSPQDYHQKRGRGSSRFLDYGGSGVATNEDDWCARYKQKNAKKVKP